MSIIPPDIETLISAEKELAFRPPWDEKSDPRYVTLTAPLIIGEQIVGGFELRLKVSKEHVDRDAMAQLEYALTGRKREELWRCEWRPLNGHQNKNWGPPGYALRRFRSGISHHHPFAENWVPNESRMRKGSLPAAYPIEPEPTTYSDFLAFCANRFNIKNIEMIEPPMLTPDLFWTPDNG